MQTSPNSTTSIQIVVAGDGTGLSIRESPGWQLDADLALTADRIHDLTGQRHAVPVIGAVDRRSTTTGRVGTTTSAGGLPVSWRRTAATRAGPGSRRGMPS